MKKDYTFMCLRAINHAAKRQGEIKKAAYAARDHQKCAAAKATQNELYLLKALTIISLEREGLIRRGARCVDGGKEILETFYTAENHCFHAISQNQEVKPDEMVRAYERRSRDYSGCEMYRPYAYYLQQRLPDDLRNLQYHILHDKAYKLCEELEKYNVEANIYHKRYGWGEDCTFSIQLFFKGLELGAFDKYSSDTDFLMYYVENNTLTCGDYEDYHDFIRYLNYQDWI